VNERLTTSFCIGCHRVDVRETCIAECDERALDLVFASDHEQAVAAMAGARRLIPTLQESVRQILSTTPADGDFEENRRVLRVQARSVLHDVNALEQTAEVERFPVSHCLACGLIEAPQECLGICVYHTVEMVAATTFDAVAAPLGQARQQVEQMGAVLRQLAWVTPRAGDWQRTWRALQDRARTALAGSEPRDGPP
jgi:Fe-S-cluster-containing hydrogenase component 2